MQMTFKQAAKHYPAFTEPSLRWLRFNGDVNGFNRCVRKVGRRVILNTELFDVWLNDQAAV